MSAKMAHFETFGYERDSRGIPCYSRTRHAFAYRPGCGAVEKQTQLRRSI